MADTFLEFIESIDARDLNTAGVLTRDDPAFATNVNAATRRYRNVNPQVYRRALFETVKLIDDVRAGRRSDFVLREAMSTSDFPLLFGDIIDRAMLGNYAEWPQTWQNIARRTTVRDFRPVQRHTIDGAEGILSEVKELTEYPATELSESKYTITVKKYGRRMPFSWELIVNDDMNALADVPARFARAARRSEDYYVTQLYVDASGPKSTVYTVGNANVITGNPALSIAAMQTALTILSAAVDDDNQPIMIEAVELVVPPALEFAARNIINATQLEIVDTGGTSNQRLIVNNWLRNRLRVTVNPYIPIVASTANGNTSWFLFASASSSRPAIDVAFLRGYEQPQLFMKSPNAVRVGGGAVDPMQGDFDTDSIDYKIRHVFGGGLNNPSLTVASNGSGS